MKSPTLPDVDDFPEPELQARAVIAAVGNLHRPIIESWTRQGAKVCAECSNDWPCHTQGLIYAYRRRVAS